MPAVHPTDQRPALSADGTRECWKKEKKQAEEQKGCEGGAGSAPEPFGTRLEIGLRHDNSSHRCEGKQSDSGRASGLSRPIDSFPGNTRRFFRPWQMGTILEGIDGDAREAGLTPIDVDCTIEHYVPLL